MIGTHVITSGILYAGCRSITRRFENGGNHSDGFAKEGLIVEEVLRSIVDTLTTVQSHCRQ